MHDRQRKRNERNQRVDVFMDAAAADFPAGSKGAVLAARLKELQTEISALEVLRAANKSKRRQGTEGRAGARTALRQRIKLAWGTLNTIALDSPSVRGLFEPPSRSYNDRALVTTAHSYADMAAPHAELFAEYGLTAAFFSDLRAQADNLEANVAQQNAGVGAGVGATVSVEEALREADLVVERLDTVITNRYQNDPAKLAAWQRTRRVESAQHSRNGGDDAAPPTAPPANG